MSEVRDLRDLAEGFRYWNWSVPRRRRKPTDKGEFARPRFRTPLNAIAGYAQLFQPRKERSVQHKRYNIPEYTGSTQLGIDDILTVTELSGFHQSPREEANFPHDRVCVWPGRSLIATARLISWHGVTDRRSSRSAVPSFNAVIYTGIEAYRRVRRGTPGSG